MFGFNKTPEEKITAQIRKRLGKVAAKIATDNLRKHIQFTGVPDQDITANDSKVGGAPYLPATLPPPSFEARPLKFLLQLNCSDLNLLSQLPTEGMLYFFIDLTEERDQFPDRAGQVKVIYNGDSSHKLHPAPSLAISELTEERLTPSTSFSIPDFNSHFFKNIELSDDEKDQLIDLKFGAIPEIVGEEGLFAMGVTPDADAVYEWSCKHLGIMDADGRVDWDRLNNADYGEELKKNVEKTLGDWMTLMTCTLDHVGYPDSWLHIGIRIEDLKTLNFDRAVGAIVTT